MSVSPENDRLATVPNGVGDAVGVKRRQWYVALVNHNTEKASQERLEKLNYETYVAKQSVIRVWKNGRKGKVDKVVIPGMIFIKCTEKERREIVALPYINRFLTNRAATSVNGLSKPLAVIPQTQIDKLRFMLGQCDIPVSFVETPFNCHDKVKITRGNLQGLEGEVIRVDEGKSEVIIKMDILGSAKISVDSINLQKIK